MDKVDDHTLTRLNLHVSQPLNFPGTPTMTVDGHCKFPWVCP